MTITELNNNLRAFTVIDNNGRRIVVQARDENAALEMVRVSQGIVRFIDFPMAWKVEAQ